MITYYSNKMMKLFDNKTRKDNLGINDTINQGEVTDTIILKTKENVRSIQSKKDKVVDKSINSGDRD